MDSLSLVRDEYVHLYIYIERERKKKSFAWKHPDNAIPERERDGK